MNSRTEIARGWDLFHLGAFAEVESLLAKKTHDDEAVRLLLWVSLRRGDASSKRCYGEKLALSGDHNLAAVGRAHENVALLTLGLDLKPWLSPVSKWAQAETAYARALAAFIGDRSLDIQNELRVALPQSPEQRVRYAQLRAWSKALGDDFVGQAHLLSHALTLALKERVDRSLVAIVAGSLAVLVREVELGDVGLHADELLERVEWPVDPSIYQFYSQWAIAWRKATCGDWIPAMDLLDRALNSAPDTMHRALIFADRARISRAIGEQVAATSSISFAFDALKEMDWPNARNDEAICVMSMMDILALEPGRVRPILESISSTKISKMMGDGHGRRFDAFKSFALSYTTEGDEALGYARDAYRLFKGMKYLHRATDCALRAVEVGGGSRWKKRVERLIAPYPRSLSAHQHRCASSPLSRIQGRKREVMDLLVTTSKTAREIGIDLCIAEGTVRVHIKHIKKILNVESRSQLVRLCLAPESAA